MKILMVTAPFESENTGDITYVRQIEKCLKHLGHDITYLRAQDLGLAVEVNQALDTSIRLSEVRNALKKIGDVLVNHILETTSKDTVLFMHFRIPHTGFSFSAEHLSLLKSVGYKICALINEHTCNRGEPIEIERNYQTAQLIPFFDQIITFNPIDRAGLLQISQTRNFYHCAVHDISFMKNSAWSLFRVSDNYPSNSLLAEQVTLIPAPILSTQRYDAGPDNRPLHILMFGTVRRNKGNTVILKLARLLAEREVSDMHIKIVGKVMADMNGFCSFKQYVSSTFPEQLGFCADFQALEHMLSEKDRILAELSSVDVFENEFNTVCKKIVSELESQITTNRRKAMPIEFHFNVNNETFKSLCHQSRYGVKFDKKGFCDNASTIINMMGFGLIVISNKTHMTNPIFTQCSMEELPLVLLEPLEPDASLLFQTILNLNDNISSRRHILKNLERVMTTMFDPMCVAEQVAEVLRKTITPAHPDNNTIDEIAQYYQHLSAY